MQHLADRISGVFVPLVIALTASTLGFWLDAGRQTQPELLRLLVMPAEGRPWLPAHP